jgi:hypothetical protein
MKADNRVGASSLIRFLEGLLASLAETFLKVGSSRRP